MIRPSGERLLSKNTLLLEWEKIIDPAILQSIISYQSLIESQLQQQVTECYPAYNCLAVCFDPEKVTASELLHNINQLSLEKVHFNATTWQLPVCYDPNLAPDLETFASEKQVSIDEVINLHTNSLYTVHFFGFLPGFMYLGGLNEELHLPRKTTPDRSVPKGAVAIGGSQTGIYPSESPGGWHIIGLCPIPLFDAQHNPPCFIAPGDQIKLNAVSKEEFLYLEKEADNESFEFKSLIHG